MEKNKKLKLTSVKVVPDLYSKFKNESEETNFTLQRLVNRAIYLYQTDEEFKNKIATCDDLIENFKNKRL